MNNFIEFLKELTRKGFYGRVEIVFQDGQITTIRQEACYKPNTLPTQGATREQQFAK
jgi:hypothetical protein